MKTAVKIPVVACRACGVQFQDPQPSDAELAEIYGPRYFLQPRELIEPAMVPQMKQATANFYLDLLESRRSAANPRLLEIGSGEGDFLAVACRRAYQVTGVEFSPHACRISATKLAGNGTVICGEIDQLRPDPLFDVVVASDVIEHVRDPGAFLRAIRQRLVSGGTLLIATPSLDSWSARVLGRLWMEYKREHLTYFSRSTLTTLLQRCGFGRIAEFPGRKYLCLDYVAAHFNRFPVPVLSPLLRFAQRQLPRACVTRQFRVVASGMIVIGEAVE